MSTAGAHSTGSEHLSTPNRLHLTLTRSRGTAGAPSACGASAPSAGAASALGPCSVSPSSVLSTRRSTAESVVSAPLLSPELCVSWFASAGALSVVPGTSSLGVGSAAGSADRSPAMTASPSSIARRAPNTVPSKEDRYAGRRQHGLPSRERCDSAGRDRSSVETTPSKRQSMFAGVINSIVSKPDVPQRQCTKVGDAVEQIAAKRKKLERCTHAQLLRQAFQLVADKYELTQGREANDLRRKFCKPTPSEIKPYWSCA
eukprot:694786-Pleurochrysis_carterae.AAC.2